MKILKYIGIGLVVLVVLFMAGGLMMRSTWNVERSVVAAAKPEHVIPHIIETKKWGSWAAWNNEMDPAAKYVYFGAPSGVGSKMAWEGPKLGKGMLTITEVTPTSVSYEMTMEGKVTLDGENSKMEGGTPSKGGFTFTAEGDGTKIVWKDTGDMGMNLPFRYFVPMMEKMLGDHFDIGLKNLAKLSEEAKAAADKAAAEARPQPVILAEPAPE